jgi:hypothetical protein
MKFTYKICSAQHSESADGFQLSIHGLSQIPLTAPSKSYQRTVYIDVGSLNPSRETIFLTMSTNSSDGVCLSHVEIDDAIIFEKTMWLDNPCDGSFNPCSLFAKFLSHILQCP